jgi:xanthine dehydrogenase small subunit
MRGAILFYINGERVELGAEHAGMMLADFLRYRRGLTGTKIVCAEGDCGACSVLRFFPGVGAKKNGRSPRFLPVNSCITTCAQLDGSSLVTVEALGSPEKLHPVQAAMKDCHGSQCGFCTPGFVVALAGLVEKKIAAKETSISEREAKNATTGNLCRCTGYQPILDAARAIEPAACESVAKRYYSAVQEKDLRAALAKPAQLKGSGFELYAPTSLKQAAAYLAKNKQARLLGSATDLGVVHNKGKLRLEKVVSLHLVPELYELSLAKGTVRVGARVSLAELRRRMEKPAPELARFLDLFASPQIKNIATLAGNVANASPIADTPPFLLLADAVVETFSSKGKREIPLRDFYLAYRKTALRAGELITAIRFLLPPAGDKWALYKASERKDLDISSVNAALRVAVGKDGRIGTARVAFGGVAATPLRLAKTEKLLEGQAPSAELLSRVLLAVQEEISPLSDVRGSAAFRRLLAEGFVRRFFRERLGVEP